VRFGVLALALAFLLPWTALADDAAPQSFHLLLNSRLLRRLKRDAERQTPRWTAFETRVKTVPDSTERGFELALYAVVAGDSSRSQEAVSWAASHPCELRQTALIADWLGTKPKQGCVGTSSLRDQAFQRIVSGLDVTSLAQAARDKLVPSLARDGVPNMSNLYAAIELIDALRSNGAADIRSEEANFFQHLAVEFLLGLKPAQVLKPDWITHIAALALVALDPNLEASQFLQGWAMENSQTLHDGPGVAYELLWADPYLPGIAYQNLDPWFHNEANGRLFARSDWNADACWISISTSSVSETQCPHGWRDKEVHFGSLTLFPALPHCFEIPHQDPKSTLIVWKLDPGQAVTYHDAKEITAHADAAGMWQPSPQVAGKICRSR
jgi:hypothetical protein